MLEIKKKLKPVKIEDKIHNLFVPSYKQTLQYEEDLKACKTVEEKADCVFSYLAKLGLPKEVATDLDVDNIREIISYLAGEKKS